MELPARDKLLHFVAGQFAAILFYAFWHSAIALAIGAIIAGVMKEAYDITRPDEHTPETMDVVATFAGCIPLVVIHLMQGVKLW